LKTCEIIRYKNGKKHLIYLIFSFKKLNTVKLNNLFLEKLLPLPMYGSLPNAEQLKVFWRTAKDTRKVIVATNIAETSITIPNIVYGILVTIY